MIIAAFAGTGKSYLSAIEPSVVDLNIMPYKYVMEEEANSEAETEKGADYLIINPDYPENYILALLQAELTHKYVLIPSDMRILDILIEQYGRKAVLVHPFASLKEEYRERYKKRGNSNGFLEIFYDNWEHMIKQISSYGKCEQIMLDRGMYLSDVFSDIQKITEYVNYTPPLPEDMERLKAELSVPKPLILMDYNGKGKDFYTHIYVDSTKKQKEVYGFGQNYYRKYKSSPFQMSQEMLSIIMCKKPLKELEWKDFKRKTLTEFYRD